MQQQYRKLCSFSALLGDQNKITVRYPHIACHWSYYTRRTLVVVPTFFNLCRFDFSNSFSLSCCVFASFALSQVRDATRSSNVLGRARVHVMATKDGSTLMWAIGKDREPVALRWQPAMGPWRVSEAHDIQN